MHVFSFLTDVCELLRMTVDCHEVLPFGIRLENIRVVQLALVPRIGVLPTRKHVVNLLLEVVDFCNAL